MTPIKASPPLGIERRGFSIVEAAHYAGVHRSTLYRLIKKGDLKLRKIAGRSIILRDDMDRMLEAIPEADSA